MGRVFLADARRYGNSRISYWACSVKQWITAEMARLDWCCRVRLGHDSLANDVRRDHSVVGLYGHHFAADLQESWSELNNSKALAPANKSTTATTSGNLARPEGFEPPTFWSVARRSIQLS